MLTHSEIISLIRPRIYDERNPITVLKARTTQAVDTDETALINANSSTVSGVLSNPVPDELENWVYGRVDTLQIEPIARAIEATVGWEASYDQGNLFFLQEGLLDVVNANANQIFVEFKVKHRFTDDEISREIDSVITEIDPTKDITNIDLRWKMFITHSVCYRLCLIRAADSFGANDIDVSQIAIPGVSVSFKTATKLWETLAEHYKDLVDDHGSSLVGGDISMPTINEENITIYDRNRGVQKAYNDTRDPVPVILTAKTRGSYPDNEVLLQWNPQETHLDFKEYRILKSSSPMDIPEDGTEIELSMNFKRDIKSKYYLDTDVEEGLTYYYRIMYVLADLDNRNTIYSLSNEMTLTIPETLPPVATGVNITGTPNVGETLTGAYTYSDPESNPEAGTTFRWLTSDELNGTYVEIVGETTQTYVVQGADIGMYIKFEVTPRSSVVATEGEPVESSGVEIV